MSNFRTLGPDEKVYVNYKNYNPARVVAVEKRGRKHYLLLRWENFPGYKGRYFEKWVRDTFCVEHKPTGKGTTLAWWQKLIIKLQNWWYGIKT